MSTASNLREAPGPTELIDCSPVSGPLQFVHDLVEEHGDVVRYRTRFGPCFLFAHPKHVQAIFHDENYRRASLVKMMVGEGLLASDGPLWRSQRQLMQRDFVPRRVAPFVALMQRETERTCAEWNAAAISGVPVDIAHSMTRLTVRIVVAALFSTDLTDQDAARLCAAVSQVVNELGRISWTIFGAPVAFTPQGTAEFRGAKDLIDAICYDVIARRHRTPAEQRPRDLLTMLIESGSDADALNQRQLRDEMVTMLIGGHETTAVALAWSWKALAEHPDIERRLHAEVDQAGAGEATEPLSGLAWGRAIFQESMRLYPPVWYAARVAINDGVIDGYSIPRGACVLISAWVTHRHTAFWNQPERFAPDRFLDTDQPFHREAYLPFGGGRHTCLGMHFALLEGTLILAELSRRFCVRPTNAGEVRTHPGITLRQSPGLRARIEIRATEPVRDPVP